MAPESKPTIAKAKIKTKNAWTNEVRPPHVRLPLPMRAKTDTMPSIANAATKESTRKLTKLGGAPATVNTVTARISR